MRQYVDTVGDDTDTTFERETAEETEMIMAWSRRNSCVSDSIDLDVVLVHEDSDDYEDHDFEDNVLESEQFYEYDEYESVEMAMVARDNLRRAKRGPCGGFDRGDRCGTHRDHRDRRRQLRSEHVLGNLETRLDHIASPDAYTADLEADGDERSYGLYGRVIDEFGDDGSSLFDSYEEHWDPCWDTYNEYAKYDDVYGDWMDESRYGHGYVSESSYDEDEDQAYEDDDYDPYEYDESNYDEFCQPEEPEEEVYDEDTDYGSEEFEDEAWHLEGELEKAARSGDSIDHDLVDQVRECISRLGYYERYSLEHALSYYLWVLEERALAEAEAERIAAKLEEREGRRAMRRHALKRYRDRGNRAGFHPDQHPQPNHIAY